MSKNKGSSSTTTVQKADPWSGQQPYLTDIFGQAQQQYYGNGPYYYPGDTVSGFQPAELQAQSNLLRYSQDGATQLTNQGLGAQSFLLGDVLRADSNPYMADYAAGAISPVWDALLRQGLPAIDSGAIASGQYGGSRQGIAQGIALGDATRNSLNTTAQMYSDMYGKNLDALQKAVMLNPSIVQSGALPAEMMAGVGAQRRDLNQALIDDALARWQWEQALPSTKLAQYGSNIQGQYGGASTSTTEGDTGGTSTAGKVAGAAATGLGTFAALSSPSLASTTLFGVGMSTLAPWAAGAAALATLFG